MNIIFLTLGEIDSVEDRGIYQDLLRKFRNEGHDLTIVTPAQRRRKIKTHLIRKEGVSILQVKTLNIQKTNILEKGVGTIMIEYQYLSAIKKYVAGKKFDLVLYSTPPITFSKVIDFLKQRDRAFTYLLLKDIFPQNAVDMKMIKNNGIFHRYFLGKEKKLYKISDAIGCMSDANVSFVLKNHPDITAEKLEVNPNSIEPLYLSSDQTKDEKIRQKYKIPTDKKILVYGGNLGKPQGVDFLLETIAATNATENAHFLIVGEGTEFPKIQNWFNKENPQNATLLRKLPKEDYDLLLMSCDIGLIFLDKNFTIPNFPARLLSYLEMGKPVIAATDPHTDVGDIIQNNKCGFKVISGDQAAMQNAISKLLSMELELIATNCKDLLERDYKVDRSYRLIMNRIKNV